MPERPSIDEIAAFLSDIRAAGSTPADSGDLLGRKAELLERIAATMPGDSEAAEVARIARAAVDEHSGQ